MNYSATEALQDITRRIACWRERAENLCSSPGAVLLFGAGNYGRFLAEHVLPPGGAQGIIDNNPGVWGQTIGGLAVIAPTDAAAAHPGAKALVTVANRAAAEAIAAQCRAAGLAPIDFAPESLASGLPPFAGSHINLWLSGGDDSSFEAEADAGAVAPLDDFIGKGVLVSYADAGEDAVFLEYLWPVKQGFYVDVGCADPQLCSVTKMFYDLGWSGVNIDPRAVEMAKYTADRPRDVNLTLGVSNAEGELPFWEAGFLSTFSREQTEAWREHPVYKTATFRETVVAVATLDRVLARHAPGRTVHFLKIDAETHEKQVLEWLDLSRCRPWMIMVEEPTGAVKEHLSRNNYELVRVRSVNHFYAAGEKKRDLLDNCLAKPVFYMLRREQAGAAGTALAAAREQGRQAGGKNL